MRILHLSADYPDPLGPGKTRAIANLLTLARGFEHRVMSLNRIDWRQGTWGLDFSDPAGGPHLAVAYGAPSKGVFMKRYLNRLADRLIEDCRRAGFRPDLVHAHKLSVEGLIGARMARHYAVPLAVSIQGNSDLKIVGFRRDLRPLYARIWQEASVVFPFAPWAARELGRHLGPRRGMMQLLPCPGPADSRLDPISAPPVVATAFHMRDWENKNAAGLIKAVAIARRILPEISLQIIGGGSAQGFAELSRLAQATLPGRVTFVGPVQQEQVQSYFNKACVFALPSFRESFGMVFSEALLAGTPCLIPRNRAIDGYFEEGSVLLSADPGNSEEIANALVRLIREQGDFKARLRELGEEGGLEFLRRDSIRRSYEDAVHRVVAQSRGMEPGDHQERQPALGID